MEKITIEGNLGKDAAYSIAKYPDALRFSVGVGQGTKEEKKPAIWYDVVCWKKEVTEKLVLKLKKGVRVQVMGKPTLRVWIDSEGAPKGQISISAYQVELVNLKSNADGGNLATQEKEATITMKSEEMPDDDIPF